ncbi:hypothetical protein EMCRGX_G031276 [Ephydatia muelleri]
MAAKRAPTYDPNLIEVKSKFECEYRRFNLNRMQLNQFEAFHALVKESHHLPSDMPFTISYTDPRNGDLLPINNDDNLVRAFTTAVPLLRVIVYRKQEFMLDAMNDNAKHKGKKKGGTARDRRVKLLKQSSDRPLGFYIRDGTSVRVTPYGLEKVPGIFISRLVPGGLAEGTGLLSVNDEIIEVNGIEVFGKSLDQVTDMMVANSQNLIITVKPAAPPPTTPPRSSSTIKGKGPGGNLPTKSPSMSGTKGLSESMSQISSSSKGGTSKKGGGSEKLSQSMDNLETVKNGTGSAQQKKATKDDRPLSYMSERQTSQNDASNKRYSVGGNLEST